MRKNENFEHIWKSDTKILLRKLYGVDMKLQENKVVNLKLASKKIDGLILKPGEEFSFWNLIGNATKLYGEIRSTKPLDEKYKIVEEGNHYAKDEDGGILLNGRKSS